MSDRSLLTPANDPYLLSKTQQLLPFLSVSRAGKESLSLSRSIDPSKQRLCLQGSDGVLLRVPKAQKALSLGSLLSIQEIIQMARGDSLNTNAVPGRDHPPTHCTQNLGSMSKGIMFPFLSCC